MFGNLFFAESAARFKPTNIPNCILWLDATSSSSIIMGGSGVSEWKDLSGVGNNATQGTASSQPAYNTNQINGKPTVTFNSTSSVMLFSGISVTNFTAFGVANYNSSSSTGPFIANPGGLYFGNYIGTLYLYSTGVYNLNASVPRDTTARASYVTVDTSSQVLYSGASSVATTSSTATPSMFTELGERNAGEWFGGNMAEVILYNRTLTTIELNEVYSYLKLKWNTL